MNRLIIADIKTPVTKGKCMGHFMSLAHNYFSVFNRYMETMVSGGPIYAGAILPDNMLPLPYNLNMVNESAFINKCKYFINAWTLFHQCSNDVIIVQQGADVTFFIATLLFCHRYNNNKIFLIQYSTYAIQGVIKRSIYRLAKRKLDGIICPNDEVGKAFGIPYCVTPDYFYIGDITNEQISYRKKPYDVCILGRIEPEKGVVEAVRWLKGTSLKVIVAGKASAQIEQELKTICDTALNITLNLTYISDDLYIEYIRLSRFCMLNYSDEYSVRSSGAVYDMLYNNVPIIGRKCKALQFILDFGMGYLFDDVQACDIQMFSEANYDRFVQGITNYLSRNIDFQKRLFSFVGISCTA